MPEIWVTVLIDHDDEGPEVTVNPDTGAILIVPSAINTVAVYGPFATEEEAQTDAKELRMMGAGAVVHVCRIEGPAEADEEP